MPTLPGILAQIQQARDELAADLKVYDDMLATASKQNKGKSPSASETFICPECGKEFGGGGALGSHRSLKHGVKGDSKKAQKKRDERENKEGWEQQDDSQLVINT